MNLRDIVRSLLLIGGLALALRLLNGSWLNYRWWRDLKLVDPSAAGIYSGGCLIDGSLAFVTLAIAGALFFLTRQKAKTNA